MKKKSLNSENEIDLIELTKTIWDGKIKIVLIIIVSLITLYGYNQLQPKPKPKSNLYSNSLTIKPTNNSEFYKLLPMYNSLELNNTMSMESRRIDNVMILNDFVRELLDFEELIYVLKNNKSILKKIAKLPEDEQTKKLYDYTRLFTIAQPKEELGQKLNNYVISFVWENPDECKEILDQTIKLAISNLEKSIFMGLSDMLEVKKNKIVEEDSKRIEFLLEQSSIAKELNLPNKDRSSAFNSANIEGISPDDYKSNGQYNLSLNFNTNDASYYLRGYKAIDKEINIIKNRDHIELNNIKNKIDILRESNIEWISYNIFLLDSTLITKQTINKTTIPLYLGIVFGLIIGVFYVYISNALRSLETTKK